MVKGRDIGGEVYVNGMGCDCRCEISVMMLVVRLVMKARKERNQD